MNNIKKYLKLIKIEKELDERGIDYKYHSDGNRIVLKCVLHNDKDEAFYINVNSKDKYFGICHCFGCGWHRDIFVFLSEYDGVPLKKILQKYKKTITVKEIQDFHKSFTKLIKQNKKVEIKPEKSTIKVYKDSALQKFTNKYPLSMIKYLKSRNLIDLKLLKKNGLMYNSNKESKYYNKMVFIYKDVENKLRGFGYRKIGEIPKTDLIKINKQPKGNQATQILYGLHNVLVNNYFGKRKLILVEGEFDTNYLQQFKYPAVGLGHSSISEGQLNEINLYCSVDLYLFLDGDRPENELLKLKKKLKKGLVNQNRIFIIKIEDKTKDPNDHTEDELKLLL